ncbi:TonB-dependent receptor [uncultured Aquimarina sp.]|uniref:SusC/RagA family TonB-linked outer membrane protein n=1 Tax=uncultured Aquimarina sp. TaxID=575652 RepID=UPI0026072AC7|nr:TonB-dependent receptor [uncultured Aquimarina sp.]
MRNILLYLFIITTQLCVAQENTVTGKTVNSNSGEPLPFVNIINKSNNSGATSDFDGLFSLIAEKGETLEFSSVGFKTIIIVVGDTTVLDIQLEEDVAELESVVVIGYGTQRKKEVTGAVATVKAEVLDQLQPQKAIEGLRGTTAGVQVTQQGGNPGAAFNIAIRGVSSNVNNEPQVFIDGGLSDFDNINPDDIETFTVLKDAQAAIYGVSAGNGVILITTKSGKKNKKASFSYSTYTGFQNVSKKINVLNATEYGLIQNEKFINGGGAIRFANIASLGRGTDWQEEIFTEAPITNHSLQVTGGGDKYSYLLSGAHLDQEGAIGGKKAKYIRDNVRLKLNVDLSPALKLSTDVNYLHTNNKGVFANGLGSVTFNALNNEPYLAVRDENGVLTLGSSDSSNEVYNPVTQLQNSYNDFDQSRVSGNIALDYKIFPNLRLKPRFNITNQSDKARQFTPSFFYGPSKSANVADEENTVSEQFRVNNNYVFDFVATYNKTFVENHQVTLTLGTTAQRFWGYGISASAFDVPFNSWEFATVANGTPFSPSLDPDERPNPNNFNGKYEYENTKSAFFGRLQYDFKGKYLLSALYRIDKSSSFGPEFNTGFFPSFTAGWIVSEEEFLNDSNTVNFLKLRGSYGIVGNDAALSQISGAFRSNINATSDYAIGGGNQVIFGVAPGRLPNPNLKWEEAKLFDVGVDLELFDNKVSIVADYFDKTTEDLLVDGLDDTGLSGGSAPGSSFPVQNAGTVVNKGFEFSINYNKQISKNLELTIGGNFTTIDNEVTKVNQGGFIERRGFRLDQASTRFQEGLPIGSFYGYQTDGIFQTQAEIDNHALYNLGAPVAPGDLKFVDINNDGEITEDDRTYIGDPLPDFTLGINLTLEYKGFDLGVYTYASVGNELLRSYERDNPAVNQLDYVLGRWTGPGSSNTIPRVTTEANNNGVLSSFYVEDASYFRINNVQLGYNLPSDVLDKLRIEKVRVYGTVNNVYTFTEYKGYDPAALGGDVISRGVDNGFYPSVRTMTLGLNVKF